MPTAGGHVGFSICMLGNFACFFLSANFFQVGMEAMLVFQSACLEILHVFLSSTNFFN